MRFGTLIPLLLFAGCATAPRGPLIVDRPISFSERRVELTRTYIADRYGITAQDIGIVPRMVVLHWTAIDGLAGSFRAFDPEVLGGRADIAGAGDVNVSIQFLVDRDGTIYRLMPETWMARHVIGLNYDAIGVENVGGADGVDNLTDAQVRANIELVQYLRRKYPTIEYLIGHHEYQRFERHPLWRERDANYRTVKIDPGERFMAAVRAGVSSLALRGAPAASLTPASQTTAAAARVRPPKPDIVPHAGWHSSAPVGHAADAARRNLAPGDTLTFRGVQVVLLAMEPRAGAPSIARLELTTAQLREVKEAPAGSAFNWGGLHFAILAVNTGGGLGAGLVELEAGTVASLPAEIVAATRAGDATFRMRVPHEITMITLHHTGSPQPLLPEEDPAAKLRGLQSWGQAERNWWDVPYHFLIDLEGRIYEGRDYRFMGETNTRYNPSGHLLISVIGNYDVQQPTAAQIEAVTSMMAWAAAEFDVPVERIYGHGDLTATSCPGVHLKKFLDDRSFHRAVAERLNGAR